MNKLNDSLVERENKKDKADLRFTMWIGIGMVVLFAIFFLFTNVLLLVQVDGGSMENTLYSGEGVFVNRYARIDRGDIVVIERGDHLVIKRVIAMEGDTVRIEGGKVYLTQKGKKEVELKEDYLKRQNFTFTEKGKSHWTVGENQIFYLGDNREVSLDSRKNGCCSLDDVVGEVGNFALSIKSVTTKLANIFGEKAKS